MSIVGTRPPLISETNLYEPRHKVNPFLGPTINFSLLHSNTWCFARNPLIFPSLSTFNSPTIDVSAYFT